VAKEGRLRPQSGYVAARPPRDRAFKSALAEELDRLSAALGLQG